VPKKIKGTGPNGTLTPLDGKPVQLLDKPKPRKQISLPTKLLKTAITPRMLANGKLQKQVLAFFALHLSPTLFNELNDAMKTGDVSAMRLVADMYGFTQKAGGLNILVNQQNNNGPSHRDPDGKELASFEEIARSVAQHRQRMKTIDAEPVFVATPEG
jgi:hypothetical protein